MDNLTLDDWERISREEDQKREAEHNGCNSPQAGVTWKPCHDPHYLISAQALWALYAEDLRESPANRSCGAVEDTTPRAWWEFLPLVRHENQAARRRWAYFCHAPIQGFLALACKPRTLDCYPDATSVASHSVPPPDVTETEYLQCLMRVALEPQLPAHRGMLLQIYHTLTSDEKEVAMSGAHFERIGFQGSNPGTDLRSTGMFGLLIVYAAMAFYPDYVNRTFQASQNPKRSFGWILVALNLISTCAVWLQREELSHRIPPSVIQLVQHSQSSRPSDTSTPPVSQYREKLSTVTGLFVILLKTFVAVWEQRAERPITDFDGIRKFLHGFVLEGRDPSEVAEVWKE